jgi:hypothetical protein
MAYHTNDVYGKGHVHGHKHHISLGKLSLAASLAASILYSLCVAFLAFMPKQALDLAAAANQLTTLDMFAPYVKVTFGSFLTGFILTFLCTYLLVWLTGVLYCAFACKDKYPEKHARDVRDARDLRD